MNIPIESGIPIPGKGQANGVIEQLRRLDVGQSVLLPGKTSKQSFNYIRPAKRGTPKCFTVRAMTTGVRIWRTE